MQASSDNCTHDRLLVHAYVHHTHRTQFCTHPNAYIFARVTKRTENKDTSDLSVFTRSQRRRKRLEEQQSKGVNAFTGGRACTTRSRARIHPHIACTLHARRHPRRHAHRHIRTHTYTHTHTYARMLTHRFAQIKRTHVKKHPRAPHAHTHTRAHMCARTHTAQAKFQETSSLLAKGALVLRKLDLEKPLRTRSNSPFQVKLPEDKQTRQTKAQSPKDEKTRRGTGLEDQTGELEAEVAALKARVSDLQGQLQNAQERERERERRE